MDSRAEFNENSLPNTENFHDSLNFENISKLD